MGSVSYELRGASYKRQRWFATACVASLALISALLTGARSVWACSGGLPTTLNDLTRESVTLIRGRMLEYDAARQNGIMAVDAYIGAAPIPNTIFVSHTTPATVQGVLDMNVESCIYLFHAPPKHEQVYLAVHRDEVGRYWSVGSEFYQFTEASPTQHVFVESDTDGDGQISPEEFEGREVEEAGFAALVEELSGRSFTEPTAETPYPVTAPLVVETTDGSLFFVPVDLSTATPTTRGEISRMYAGSVHMPLSMRCGPFVDEECEVLPETDFQTYRIYEGGEPDAFLSRYGYRLASGDRVLTSAAGTSVIWDDNVLTFYQIVPNSDSPVSYIEASIALEADIGSHPPPTVWSRDSRRIAYGDRDGIWVVEVVPNSDPEIRGVQLDARLVWEASGSAIPEVVRISPSGRYLTIRDGDDEFNLDLAIGQRLTAGIVSPDDQYVLVYEADNEGVHWSVEGLARQWRREVLSFATIIQVGWLDSVTYAAAYCRSGQTDCWVTHDKIDLNLEFEGIDTGEPGRAFAISPRGDIAVITDDDTISVNRHTIDIDTDSPIANVYWLPSLFWGE